MLSKKAVSEIISVILVILMGIALTGTAYMWGMPLISKRQDTMKVERVHSYFDRSNSNSLIRKIEFIANNGGQETFISDVDGLWSITPTFKYTLNLKSFPDFISIPIEEGLSLNKIKELCGDLTQISYMGEDLEGDAVLEPGNLYIVSLLEYSCSIDLVGTPYAFDSFELSSEQVKGIGSPYKEVSISDVIGTCHSDKITVYKGLMEPENIVDVLQPGYGYFIETEEDCTFGDKINIDEELYDSLEFTILSKVSNIAISNPESGIEWVALTPGGSCPPEAGVVGTDPSSVICAKAEPFSDGFSITYRIWFRELYDPAGTKIYKIKLIKNPSGQLSSTSKTIRISRGDITSQTQDGKTLITTEIKILLV